MAATRRRRQGLTLALALAVFGIALPSFLLLSMSSVHRTGSGQSSWWYSSIRTSTSAACDIARARLYDGPWRISTALSSFPRSGNSWLRVLIEKSTGYLTSSMYCDHTLRLTFKAECRKSNRWLVKTHYPVNGVARFPDPQTLWRRFDRVLHIVRNPFDAILSYHHFHKTSDHTRKLARLNIHPDKLLWYVQKYRAHYAYWVNCPLPRLLVRYEDLRVDTVNELRRVTRFLQPDPRTDRVDEAVLRCAATDATTQPYRSNTTHLEVLYGLEAFNEEQVAYIVSELGDIMCQLGYNEMFTAFRQRHYSANPAVDLVGNKSNFTLDEWRSGLRNDSATSISPWHDGWLGLDCQSQFTTTITFNSSSSPSAYSMRGPDPEDVQAQSVKSRDEVSKADSELMYALDSTND